VKWEAPASTATDCLLMLSILVSLNLCHSRLMIWYGHLPPAPSKTSISSTDTCTRMYAARERKEEGKVGPEILVQTTTTEIQSKTLSGSGGVRTQRLFVNPQRSDEVWNLIDGKKRREEEWLPLFLSRLPKWT